MSGYLKPGVVSKHQIICITVQQKVLLTEMSMPILAHMMVRTKDL